MIVRIYRLVVKFVQTVKNGKLVQKFDSRILVIDRLCILKRKAFLNAFNYFRSELLPHLLKHLICELYLFIFFEELAEYFWRNLLVGLLCNYTVDFVEAFTFHYLVLEEFHD